MKLNRHAFTAPLLLFAILGIADSWYLAINELKGTPLTCNIAGLDGCNVVAQSVYSHVFGIPLGVYGVVFYAAVLILVIALMIKPAVRWLYFWLSVFGWGGLISSVIFMFIQYFVIKALCIYCLGSAILSFLICIIAHELWRRYAPAKVVAPPTL